MITTYTLNTNPPQTFNTYQGALDAAQELFATKGLIVSITEDVYSEVGDRAIQPTVSPTPERDNEGLRTNENPPRPNRYKNALSIFMDAVNPSGIAHAIIDAYNEMRDEPGFTGTAQVCKDPAIRVMVYQLAYICQVHDTMLVKDVMECKERVGDKS